MRITKRDTKRILKVDNGTIVKEKYNIVYINCLMDDVKNGMSACNLQDKYNRYFTDSEGNEVLLETWKLLSLNKFHLEESEEEFKECAFGIDDIENILPNLEEEIESIRNLFNFIKENNSDSITLNMKLKDKFNSLFKIRK
jgi:hypothetical protein